MRIGRIQMAALGIVASAALLLGACGDDNKDDTSTGTTVEAPDTTATDAETVRFDKTVQEDLKKVGCYTGAVDGIIGPETDAAIVAFQEAEGLEADGELGPETQSALDAAVEAGKTVCHATSGTTHASTTSTTAASGTPPCTATAVSAVLASGATLESYVCSGDYAGISWKSASGETEGSVLIAKDGAWATEDPSPCGAASAGIPAQVLEVGCIAA